MIDWQRFWKTGVRRVKSASVVFILHSAWFIGFANGQSPYQLKTGREIGLLGGGVVTLGIGYVTGTNQNAIDPAEIQGLGQQAVNAFDRGATYKFSHTADQLSNVSLAGTAAVLGALTLGTKPMRNDLITVGVMYVETALLANGGVSIVKNLAGRFRPFVYNPDVPLSEKTTKDARQSFFSGHATNAFATAVFTSEVFRHYFPDSKLKPVVWIGSLGLATATAVLRYEGGLHYPTDLIAGAAFGTLVGWGIPKLHEVKNRSELGQRLDVQPWSNGQATGIYLRVAVFSQ
ncbi:MAG: phosphatase PAP2 family protein [Spirosoma sp.]|nr:phosphatase PAP2 family protein [Spirosoma sp.]